ncbi:MAG: amidohydrolase family protein [Sediminibacterium sp.]|nr:amidohydrolase family protein [Sediminibacterium sp.]MDP3667004.1 amidohydrolase family protein [Sediminibacterium sp.]
MKKQMLLPFMIVGFFTFSFGQFSPGYYALKDVNVIDGVSKAVLNHYTVIIRNNTIEAVGTVTGITIPDSATVFNFSGKYLMPGLIDTHIHLATEPTKEDNRAKAEKDLYDMLMKGITSVRDMAGDARELSGLSRDALVGDILSPDIYYSALMAGPSFFNDPRTHQSSQGGKAGEMSYMRGVNDTTNLELAVAEAKGTGATAIKLYAQLNGDLAKRITIEAHKQHLQVWSHTDLTIASPQEVINAGVNTISHAGMIARWPSTKIPVEWKKPGLTEAFWNEAFEKLPINEYITAMLANKTILDPTLLVYKSQLEENSFPDSTKKVIIAQWNMAKRFTKLALDKGVPVCTGTDSDEKKFVQREMQLLVKEAGFTPMEAIISATRMGAMAIGIENKTGTVEKGKIANLVLLSANPASDIDNLEKVTLVIKNGRMYTVK